MWTRLWHELDTSNTSSSVPDGVVWAIETSLNPEGKYLKINNKKKWNKTSRTKGYWIYIAVTVYLLSVNSVSQNESVDCVSKLSTHQG